MGQEALCRVRFGDQTADGKALLETNEIIFRGQREGSSEAAFRLKIPLVSITDLVEDGEELRVSFSGGTAHFELGAKAAAKWAGIIRNPKGLIDKLGVKDGAAAAVLGVTDAAFLQQLHSKAASVAATLTPGNDFVFYEADEIDDLLRLDELKQGIKPNGAIWVVSPKGKGARVRDVDVMAAARAAGLVDTKVVSFSDTHTALKLVIPKAAR
jgi:hypothetical protein